MFSEVSVTREGTAGSPIASNGSDKIITGDKARKRGIHPGFETQGRRHKKSKTGVSVAPQKGLMSSKNFFKKEDKIITKIIGQSCKEILS